VAPHEEAGPDLSWARMMEIVRPGRAADVEPQTEALQLGGGRHSTAWGATRVGPRELGSETANPILP